MIEFWLNNAIILSTLKSNLDALNDKELFKKCVNYGRQIIKARRKFLGLLPEVFRRGLYQKKGFGSIEEFAAKLAGVSHDQVRRVLRLEARLADRPVLHSALVEGRISINKLVRIVPIVTAGNERQLFEKAEILSSRALEVFVREVKNGNQNVEFGAGFDAGFGGVVSGAETESKKGLDTTNIRGKTVHVHSLKLDNDVATELTDLQAKGIDVNAILRKFLSERRQKIEEQKAEIAARQRQESEDRAVIGRPVARYVPVEVRRVLAAEYGTRCAVEGCRRKAENLHHQKGFARDKCHDPRFIRPLCRVHHELAHAGDGLVQKYRLAAAGWA